MTGTATLLRLSSVSTFELGQTFNASKGPLTSLCEATTLSVAAAHSACNRAHSIPLLSNERLGILLWCKKFLCPFQEYLYDY